jgi:YD repeat-containing protein
MAAWAAAITDLTNTEQTVTDYDARGNVLKVTSFSTIAAGGGGASTAVAIDAGTNTTITANGDGTYSIQRTTGGFLGYSGDARSTTGVSGDFVVQVRPQSVNEYAVGVSTSPASSTALANLNYSFWMLGDGSLNYAEGGSTGSLGASYAAGDNFWLVRSGTTLSYYAGATLSAAMAGTALRTVTGVTGTFYFDTSHYTRFAPVDAAFSSAIPTTPATPLDTRITNFVYDQSGRLLSRGTPGLGTETMVYDGLGRVTASTFAAQLAL